MEVERIRRAKEKWSNRFLQRIFREGEIKYSNTRRFQDQRLAARFAAKEALIKALGEPLNWKDIEVVRGEGRSPQIMLHGKAKKIILEKGIKRILLSLSHSREYAVAQVVTEM